MIQYIHEKFADKKNITITSVIAAVILLVWGSIGNVKLCGIDTFGHWLLVTLLDWGCIETLWNIGILLLPILPVALFSLITYKMREDIFIVWINFAKWWIPLTIFLTLIAPASDSSFLPVNKGSVAFVMTALFSALSFCIIIAKWARKEKK